MKRSNVRGEKGACCGAYFTGATSNGRSPADEPGRAKVRGYPQFGPDESRGSCPVPGGAQGEISGPTRLEKFSVVGTQLYPECGRRNAVPCLVRLFAVFSFYVEGDIYTIEY